MKANLHTTRGFTLIEMLVSVAIFSIVMTMALGALLSLSVADRKAETLKSGIDNLTFALDSMSRAIRTGQNYDCGNRATYAPTNCLNPTDNYLAFLSSSGIETEYQLDTSSAICGQSGTIGCIERRQTIGGVTGPWIPITSPDLIVQSVNAVSNPIFLFHVTGAPTGDNIQPKVEITISASVPVSATQNTLVHMQTGVTQRIYDQ